MESISNKSIKGKATVMKLIYNMFKIKKPITMKALFLLGFFTFIMGILGIFLGCLLYVACNMDFMNKLHFIGIAFSFILAIFGIGIFFIGIIIFIYRKIKKA